MRRNRSYITRGIRPSGRSGTLGSGGAASSPVTTPDAIDASLLVWYSNGAGLFQDASATTPASLGDPIGRWSDAAGSVHLTAAAGQRPTLESGGSVRFDATDDRLESVLTPGALKPATLFSLFNLDSVAGYQPIFASSGAGPLGITGNGTALRLDRIGTGVIGQASVLTAGAWHRAICTYAADGTYEIFLDGVSVASGTNDQTVADGAVAVGFPGAGLLLDGAVKDMGAYSSVLSGAEITQLDAYLASL